MADSNNRKVLDPVCLMEVQSGELDIKYMGLTYSFCSQQCRQRFTDHPHLYIGKPGKPSTKQQGKSILRKRVLKLDTPVPDEFSTEIKTVLEAMMGIINVSVEYNTVTVIYDLLQATLKQIEDSIEQSGGRLSTVWRDRIKRAFIHYHEDTELENLADQHETHGCHH